MASNCKNCGKPLIGKSSKAIHCSKKCKDRYNLRVAYHKKMMRKECVYFIWFEHKGDTFLKVGRTKHIQKRLMMLQCGNPFKIKLLKMIKCSSKKESIQLESKYHEKLKKLNYNGEWFKIKIHEKSK